MISRDFLRKEYERLPHLLRQRNVPAGALEQWRAIDEERRNAITKMEAARAERNSLSQRIGAKRKAGEDSAAEERRSKTLAAQISSFEESLKELDERFVPIEETLPNVPHDTVPEGTDETANVVLKTWGEPTRFDFPPKAHWDLGPALGVLDFERAAKITGSRFTVLKGSASRLNRALIQFMLDLHTGEHGYTEIWPPVIVNSRSLFGTGQLPKFEEDLFRIRETDWYLSSTSEIQLTNLHRDEILAEKSLPVSYCAYTACFRAEAGAAGKDTRGMIRQHQFDKVELVKLTRPEDSYAAHEKLTRDAETVLERLELPYRRVVLCRGDLGFSAAKTYDLEVFLPGQNGYKEISSCSNFEAFQARRAGIRVKVEGPGGKGRNELVHTLNGSGLAVGRTLVAILENFQRQDGSVAIPKALQPYCGGLSEIRKA
ncbi:MAG TPA: serine--tRNA ligase [Thermoanaerobaculia bacterium]|jgi:seryl-tRNA synthetase|nr:serine--tRNA ligase [Thermoanaerobaculia bacterium]